MASKHKYLLFFCWISFFIGTHVAYTQPIFKRSSAQVQVKKDTALVHFYLSRGIAVKTTNLDSATYYFQKAGELSFKLNYKIGQLRYLATYTHCLNLLGKHSESLALNKKGIRIATSLNDELELGTAYLNLGISYQYTNQFDSAIHSYMLAESYLVKKPTDNLGALYSNFGNTYSELLQYEKAIEYYDKAIDVARTVKSHLALPTYLCNKSISLYQLKRYTEAETVLKETLKLSNMPGGEAVYGSALLNMGDVKIKTHQYAELKKYADEALIIFRKAKDVEGILISENTLGIYYFHQRKYDEAKKHAQASLQLAIDYESLIDQANTYILLSDIAIAEQNFSLGDDYKSTADSLKTELHYETVQAKIEEIKGKYEFERKDLEIQKLDLNNKKIIWTSFGLAVILIALGGFSFAQYTNYSTKKKLLIAQKENAIVEERLRIAIDIHDDVGSGLSRIRYLATAVQSGASDQLQGLNKVIEISDDAVQKMKEIIWSLNESNQNLETLIYYIRGQMSSLVSNSNVDFDFHIPDDIPEEFLGWRRNRHIYLLVKESINNALKHAQAKTITMTFRVSTQLCILIEDDGIGFDTKGIYKGNGLNNYKKRIAELNGSYSLTSCPGKGTELEFQIPFKA